MLTARPWQWAARTAITVTLALGSVREASAVAYGNSPLAVALAPGVVAERYPRSCGYWQIYGAGCAGWRVTGMPVPPDLLERATLITLARGGRVVIAHANGLAFTDDRGAHWHSARWDSSHPPLSVAFDANSDFGAAVGPNGNVWTTDDRGSTWRARRDDAGRTLVDVLVIGRTLAFGDAQGGLWVSTDGGTSVRTLADSGASRSTPQMTLRDRAIWMRAGAGTWWRADGSGNVERVETPSQSE